MKTLTTLKKMSLCCGVRTLVIAGVIGLSTISSSFAAATKITATTESISETPSKVMTFGLDRVEWLQSEWLGNPLWQYAASLLFLFIAFSASHLVDFIFRVQLKRLAKKTKTVTDDLLVELLRGPVKIITFVILLHVGLRIFEWPDWAANLISNGLNLVVAGSLTYLAIKLVDLGIGVWRKHIEASGEPILDLQLFPVISKSAKTFVVIVAILVTCQNLGMNVTGLLASLSIGGLAVGLAAQDTLSNLFGAVALFADKPFRVGDRIQLDAVDGSVEAIGLRSTRIRTLDGHLVTVPNRTMANATLTNVSRRPNIKTVMNIGITYDTPTEKIEAATKIINEVYRPHPMTFDLLVSFNKFENSSLNILLIHWWNSTDYKEYLAGLEEMNLELKRRFDKEGISFAFPSQTVYLRQDSDWKLAGQPAKTGAASPV